MCEGFGAVIFCGTNMGYFCEPDGQGNCSHSKILQRMDAEGILLKAPNFVCVQFPQWSIESFEFDGEYPLTKKQEHEMIYVSEYLLSQVFPICDEYIRQVKSLYSLPIFTEWEDAFVCKQFHPTSKNKNGISWGHIQQAVDRRNTIANHIEMGLRHKMIVGLSNVRGYMPPSENHIAYLKENSIQMEDVKWQLLP